jgi:hypothetical protein
MVVDRNIVHTPANSALTLNWHISIDAHLLRACGGTVRRVGHAIAGWARTPMLPYAALWEASVVASLGREPEFYERDGHVTDMPCHTDSRSRQ